jgi:hypothetical protein
MSTFNADLIDDLARQRVILFLGSGVSSSAVTRAGSRIKGWSGFLKEMCTKVDPALAIQATRLIDEKDYLLACEILQAALADEWQRLITNEFGQMADPSDLHKAIISLDQRIIITTNFDKLIESIWNTSVGNSTHLPTIISQIDPGIFSILKDNVNSYLVKLHGTVDNADSLIFSRSEYIRLAFGSSNYTNFLESMLLNYTFLFIGFSMEDPAITNLMEMYALRYPKARPHYMFITDDKPENLVAINRRLRKLIGIPYPASASHEHLPPLIDQLRSDVMEARRSLFARSLAAMRA